MLHSSARDNYEILSHTIKNSKTQKVIPSGSFFNQYAKLVYNFATPHSKIRKAGFPLDCISLDLKTGKYYYDMPKEELEQLAVEDGVLAFFEKIKKYW